VSIPTRSGSSPVGRLVEHKARWGADERGQQAGAPALAERERADALWEERRDSEPLDERRRWQRDALERGIERVWTARERTIHKGEATATMRVLPSSSTLGGTCL
jgi:hypothetical protein